MSVHAGSGAARHAHHIASFRRNMPQYRAAPQDGAHYRNQCERNFGDEYARIKPCTNLQLFTFTSRYFTLPKLGSFNGLPGSQLGQHNANDVHNEHKVDLSPVTDADTSIGPYYYLQFVSHSSMSSAILLLAFVCHTKRLTQSQAIFSRSRVSLSEAV